MGISSTLLDGPSADFIPGDVRRSARIAVPGAVDRGTATASGVRHSVRSPRGKLRRHVVHERELDPEALESIRDQGGQPLGKRPQIASRREDREERRRAHENEQRLPIHDEPIHVPVAERRVGGPRFAARRGRESLQHALRRSQDDHGLQLLPQPEIEAVMRVPGHEMDVAMQDRLLGVLAAGMQEIDAARAVFSHQDLGEPSGAI